MAMNDFNIGFLAGLDGTKSKAKLNQDIDAIKKSLKELELKAKLDPNQVKALENQLNSLKVNLNNVSIDKASLNNLVSQINNSLSGIKLQIPNLNTGNVGNQAQQVGQQIGQQIQNGINSVIQKGSFEKIFRASGNGINNVSKDAEKYFKTLSNTVSVQERLGTNNNLTSFTVSLKNAEGVAEQLNYQLRKITDDKGNIIDRYFEYSGGSINDNGVIKQLNTISAKADSLQTKLEKLKSSYSDMNASRPIKDSNNISALSQQYDKVAKSIENVRNADSASFSSMVSNAQREITVLENMVSQFRNAENVATQMKSVDISSGIAQAQERLGKLKANASGFDQMKQTIVDLDTAIANVGDKSSLDAFINKLKVAESQLGRVKAETKQLQEADKIQLSTDVTKLTTDYQKFGVVSQDVENNLKELKLAQEAVVNAKGTDTLTTEIQRYDTALDNAKSSLKELTTTQVSMNQRTSQMTSMQEWMRKNSAATKLVGNEVNKLIEECKTCDAVRFNGIKNEFKELQVQAGKAGKLGNSLFGSLIEQGKKFAQWVGVSGLVTKLGMAVKDTGRNVIELDDALTNISYTMDVTKSQLENIGNSSLQMAKDLHSSAKDVLDAVKLYANAKESADSILAKAQPAIMMSNVTGFSGETSAKYLQTIMNQFDYTQDDLMTISDTIQTVSQNIAHDFADGIVQINDAISDSGEVARAAGMDLAEYSSIIGVLVENTGLQGSQLGNAMKSIITRTTKAGKILGIDEGDISNAEKALRDIGMEVRKSDGEFKEFDDTMAELASRWDELSQVEQSEVSFQLAGTRQTSILKSLLKNWDEVVTITEKANNSSGVTLENQNTYAESLKGKITELGTIWEKIGDDAVSSSWLKGLTDVGIGVSSLIEKFGLLKIAVTGVGITTFIKNLDHQKVLKNCLDF